MPHSDEEPEFDPDLELDMPDLPSHGDSFGGASLGGGFGSSLRDDLSSLDDDQLPSLCITPSTPRSRNPSTTDTRGVPDAGDALGLAHDDAFSTPLRRSRGAGAGAPGSNRLSLAFELASAQSPAERSSNRDLLRSLGIEEDDEDAGGGEEDEDEDDDEGGYDEVVSSGYGGGVGVDLTPRAVVVVHASDSPSPPRAPKSRMSSASIASTYRDHDYFPAPDADDPTATAMAREESDAAFLVATSSLESSLSTTGVFLSHLRQHTTTDVDPHSHSHPPPRPPVSPDLFSAAQADYTDRQPLLESLATSVIKSMYDVTKQREGQVRELAEMERLVSKNEAGWQAALRNLDELPRDDDVDAVLSPSASSPRSSDAGGDEDDPVETLSTPRAPRTAPPSGGTLPQSFPSSARIELSNLRDVTTSLISALSAINEVTQVNNASVGEAGRKLRALRGHLGAAKDDLVALARSEDFVREYERKEQEDGSGGRKGRFAEMAREQMRGAEEALDEGWKKAQAVLASA